MKNPILKATLGTVGTIITISILFWVFCLNHVDINEIGVAYNPKNGQITKQLEPGWYLTTPLVRVMNISTLPFKSEVNTGSGAVVVNIKIVQFNTNGIDEYIKLQGFGYQSGCYLHSYLTSYAFSGKEYPFLTIVEDSTKRNNSSSK